MNVVVIKNHGPVRVIKINRPEKLNALSFEVFDRLGAALDDAIADAATRVLVFTGAGPKAFVAGMDVTEMAGADPLEAYRITRSGQVFFQRLARAQKPTVAMVNGYALGGGFELALSCDFIVASEAACFGFPEIRLATFPGWGGTQLAMHRMHACHAKEMIWSGKYYTSRECERFGFINRIVPAEALWDQTQAFARLFADKEPVALEFAKRLTHAAQPGDADTATVLEAALYAVNFGLPHARAAFEGLQAGFAAKKGG